jgi:hypothetical protein
VQSSRVPPLVDEAAFVKDVIKRTPSERGFLQCGFLNSSTARQVSPKMPVVSPSTLVKEDEVVGTPSHLGRCVSPSADKGEDLRVSCLVESQKWHLGRLLCGIKALRSGMGRMEYPLSLWVVFRPMKRMRLHFWLSWMPVLAKRSFIGNIWLRVKKLKVGERC